MLHDAARNRETIDLLLGHLFGVGAHDHVNFMSGAIDLFEQSLQINRSACAGRGDDQFHRENLA